MSNPPVPNTDLQIGIYEAARLAGYSVNRFRVLSDEGHIPHERICGRRTYLRADVERFISEHNLQSLAARKYKHWRKNCAR